MASATTTRTPPARQRLGGHQPGRPGADHQRLDPRSSRARGIMHSRSSIRSISAMAGAHDDDRSTRSVSIN